MKVTLLWLLTLAFDLEKKQFWNFFCIKLSAGLDCTKFNILVLFDFLTALQRQAHMCRGW